MEVFKIFIIILFVFSYEFSFDSEKQLWKGLLILIKKCIKIRLSEELFHQLNEMISRTSLSREKYLRC